MAEEARVVDFHVVLTEEVEGRKMHALLWNDWQMRLRR